VTVTTLSLSDITITLPEFGQSSVNVFQLTEDTWAQFSGPPSISSLASITPTDPLYTKLSVNPFTLEPYVSNVQFSGTPTHYISAVITDPLTIDVFSNNSFGGNSGDLVTFKVAAGVVDTMSKETGTAHIFVSISEAPGDLVAGTQGSTASGALTFPSSLDAIEALYVGYFGSPGDAAGIASSLEQVIFGGASLSSLAASFATQAAAIAEYPFLANPQSATSAQIASFVNSVYENLFQRAPTSSELTNAETALSANLGNSQFIDTFIYNTILSAQGQDQTTIDNQIGMAELTLYPQNDYVAITRTALPVAQATSTLNQIIAGTTTEFQYVSSLLSQAADTTMPAVAVEASMYGATGSSDEITTLVTQFLPAQIATAIKNGYNPVVYASEALGLQFAFADENGGTGFANNFGPSNAAMPATAAGDAAFAAAAASTIFGSAAAANWSGVILEFVENLESLYTANGIPGITSPSAAQIDLAARGAAWGEAVGIALVNNLGAIGGQTANFLEDAAHSTAFYSASLSSQPTAGLFQGSSANPFSPDVPNFPFTGDSISQIETIYIAYFGRAGDPGGTNYWGAQLASAALSITGEAASYSVQPESLTQYPFLVNPLTASTTGANNALDGFINSVYQNLFGHPADGTDTTGGLGYWRGNILTALATNNASIVAQELGAFCIQVAFGAQGADVTSLTNKVTVADYFTQLLISTGIGFTSLVNTLAHTAIASVTSDSSTVSAAEATINSFLAAHPSATLVPFVGTSPVSEASVMH
jgi:hypothetical protein